MSRRWTLILFIGLLIGTYIGSYALLSRTGIQRAAQHGSEFYFFVEPKTSEWTQVHYRSIEFYEPLIQLEQLMGAEHSPAACAELKLS